MDFTSIFSSLQATLPSISPHLLLLAQLAAGKSLIYPLTSEEEAKQLIHSATLLTKCPSLQLIAVLEPLLRPALSLPRIQKNSKKTPLLLHAEITRQLHRLFGGEFPVEIFFPRASISSFTSLSDSEQREVLSELFFVGVGYMHIFPKASPPSASLDDLSAFLEAVEQKCSIPSSPAIKYTAEIREKILTLNSLTEKVKATYSSASKGEVFALLLTLGQIKHRLLSCPVSSASLALIEDVDSAEVEPSDGVKEVEEAISPGDWSVFPKEAHEIFLSLPLERVRTAEKKKEAAEKAEEWEKLKKLLHQVNLKNKITKSTQTTQSAFRDSRETQVYESREVGNGTMVEKPVQPEKIKRYLTSKGVEVKWRVY